MVLKMKEKVDQKLQVIEVGQTTEEATNNDRVITGTCESGNLPSVECLSIALKEKIVLPNKYQCEVCTHKFKMKTLVR